MARSCTSALLLLAIVALAGIRRLHAREFLETQITRHQRHLEQSLEYGKSIGGAAKDNTVGWSVSNAEGYNAAENVVCAAGLTQCHYKPACYDLQTSAERCGSCDISCDFLTQECKSGTCKCKEAFPVCAARGGRCLDAQSCPAGNDTGSYAVDINTQGVGGTGGKGPKNPLLRKI